MNYRHEWKHEISVSDIIAIRHRMRAIAKPDPHAVNGVYQIRSLYFDNLADKALREKLDGINIREKFRIRYYNGDLSLIRLEKKSKRGGLGRKESAPLSGARAPLKNICGICGPLRPGPAAWRTKSSPSAGRPTCKTAAMPRPVSTPCWPRLR